MVSPVGDKAVCDKEAVQRIEGAVLEERKRIIGLILAEYGRRASAGELAIAKALDALATKIEHGDV